MNPTRLLASFFAIVLAAVRSIEKVCRRGVLHSPAELRNW
jgi:hypothetical protein